MVGDSGVGKSSIMSQFINNRFNGEHELTIGVDFGYRLLNVGGRVVKIQIWDTAGQEVFRSITKAYYRESVMVLLVYDITQYHTFIALKKWHDEIKEMSNDSKIMLVGNKSDLAEKRVVSSEEGRQFAENNHMLFVETSAKNGTNIVATFEYATAYVLERIDNGLIIAQHNDQLNFYGGIRMGRDQNSTNQCDSDRTVEKRSCCSN
jgi:Ras-related protein Rab-2A